MPLRRRPLMRATMVGGTAYYAGKKVQQGREREYEQEARIQDLEAQQTMPQAAPAPAGGGGLSAASIRFRKSLPVCTSTTTADRCSAAS